MAMAMGAAFGWAYVRHERRTPQAILDLSLLRYHTYAAATIGGMFPRLVLGASPFLLALLLQLAFRLSAFEAGLITCSGAIGAFAMKLVVGPIIRWLGFKPILIGNTLLITIIFASYSLFTPSTPNIVLVAVILSGGFINSLQFTALSSISFADIPAPNMSRATSLSSMVMAIAQSLGIGISAVIVQFLQARHPGAPLTAGDVTPAFLLLGGLTAFALPLFALSATGSPLGASTVFIVELVPMLVAGSFLGVLVDRWDHRRTMIVVALLQGVLLLPLLAASADRMWIVYTVAAVESLLGAVINPARRALVPSLVEPGQLGRANGLIAVSDNIARLVGSPLGGLAFALWGLPGVVLVDAATFLVLR